MVEKFVLRFPNGVRAKLTAISQDNRRSMNSQVVVLLEQEIKRHKIAQQEKQRSALILTSSEQESD